MLAVGVAVLISMMLVPSSPYELLPFFVRGRWESHILWTEFILQTVFLAVLFTVLANISWRRRK